MMPNLRHLEGFRLLVPARNVTETARLMRISQPAISQSLKALEQAFGIELFVRYGGRIAPTGEARALLPHVERVFVRLTELENVAGELRDSRAGSLAIATIPTLTSCLLPRAVAAFRRDRPQVRFRVDAFQTPDEVRAVRQESHDLGLTFAPIADHGVAAEPLLETAIVCYVPDGHPLADRPSIGMADLAETTVVVLSTNNMPGLHLAERLRKEKADAFERLEVNAASAAVALVREGVGVALLDTMALYWGTSYGIRVVPFEPYIPLTLVAVYSRHRPPSRLLLRFMPELKRQIDVLCEDLEQRGLPVRRL